MHSILIEPQELVSALPSESIILVDTRKPEEYNAQHIPGAYNMHEIVTYLSSSAPDGLQRMQEKFADAFARIGVNGEQTVVFYEQGMNTGFGQSCRGYFILQYLGYENARVLHGGFASWCAEGFPIHDESNDKGNNKSTETIASRFSASLPASKKGLSLIASKEDVLAAIENKSATLVDVRDVDEWIGESSSPNNRDFCPRKGRLPGAKWLEWYRMMKPTPQGFRMKSPNEVKAECQNSGIDLEKPIILYCFKGARTSSTFVALKEAGAKDVRTYFGSWNEWSRDESLPIETGYPWEG